MKVSEYYTLAVSVGDLVKRRCIRPEYGVIVDLKRIQKRIQGTTMVHRKLTVLWDDGTQSTAWPADVEVVNEGR